MRRQFLTACALLKLGFLSALPLGNPAQPYLLSEGLFFPGGWGEPLDPCAPWWGDINISLGFWGDYVFNRYTRVIRQNILDEFGFIIDTIEDADIQRTSIFTNAGQISLNIWGRYSFYAIIGASHLSLLTPGSAFRNLTNTYVEIETETDLSWGFGGRVTLWGFGPFSVGAEAAAFYVRPTITYVKDEFASPIYLDFDQHIRYGEWQMGLGLSYDIYLGNCSTLLVPYAGIKWSEVRLNMDDIVVGFNTLFKLESSRKFGWAVGATFVNNGMITATAEGRFGDEKALFLNAQVRF